LGSKTKNPSDRTFLKYPNEVQDELLMGLIQSAKRTSNEYDYASIRSYATFAERVPISTYEEFQPLIERTWRRKNIFWETPIKWFAKSSGTTNAKSKFIPVSPSLKIVIIKEVKICCACI
jgi:hypothetical protein